MLLMYLKLHFDFYILLYRSNMESPFEKQMFSTNRRDKIFNVRKMPHKQFDNEKYLKSNYSPLQKKQPIREPASTQPKKGEYPGLMASSNTYKQLTKKLQTLREQCNEQKQNKLKKLEERDQQLNKFRAEKERLVGERNKLMDKRQDLLKKIEELRGRNEVMRQEQFQRNEEIRMINMQYLRNMMMGMRYQNGMQIDTDNMTYEELLELEQKMGNVSKGISEEQYALLVKVQAEQDMQEVCSICYYNIKSGEWVNKLQCKHYFHVDCIREWLYKERICPLCKQEIYGEKKV